MIQTAMIAALNRSERQSSFISWQLPRSSGGTDISVCANSIPLSQLGQTGMSRPLEF